MCVCAYYTTYKLCTLCNEDWRCFVEMLLRERAEGREAMEEEQEEGERRKNKRYTPGQSWLAVQFRLPSRYRGRLKSYLCHVRVLKALNRRVSEPL